MAVNDKFQPRSINYTRQSLFPAHQVVFKLLDTHSIKVTIFSSVWEKSGWKVGEKDAGS